MIIQNSVSIFPTRTCSVMKHSHISLKPTELLLRFYRHDLVSAASDTCLYITVINYRGIYLSVIHDILQHIRSIEELNCGWGGGQETYTYSS